MPSARCTYPHIHVWYLYTTAKVREKTCGRTYQPSKYKSFLCACAELIIYTSECDFELYMYDYYATHFIRAGCVVGWFQSLSIPQSSQQTQGRDARVGNSTTSEHLPTRHSKCPLHVYTRLANVLLQYRA